MTQRQSQTFSWRPIPEEKRGFTLRVTKGAAAKNEFLLEKYLDHITQKAGEIRRRNQDRFLYTNPRGGSLDSRGHPWEAVLFKHPSTFDTLAIDPDKKRLIMDDLREFVDGEKFYNQTGRAWKRGYLLFGPPGTGKSSMIAAIANYLGYDIYDVELTEVTSNSELRKLLMKTTSKSIIVIEDIDCSLNLSNRKPGGTAARRSNNHDYPSPDIRTGAGNEEPNNNSITLSGLLNFTDGLWSCCGCERIFVFTTNHIDKLDPALLRSGRMDMHIYMSYCSMAALRILLKNYLGLGEGDVDEAVMKGIEGVIEEAEMTPADISEVLIRNRRDKGKAVRELLEELKRRAERKRENGRSGAGGGAGGGFGAKGSVGVVEEEEQEKRALEILPKIGCDQDDDEIMESCIDPKVDHDRHHDHKST